MTSSLDGERVLAELGWVQALARSLVRDPALADDVVQEAWLVALERPPRTETTRGLRAWLGRVTRTLVRSRLRSESARARREAASSRPEASEPSAHEVVARTQLQQRVVAAVMALEEPYRSSVLLRHVDGLSARAIAERQGTSVENARQRVARGIANLRRVLDREHGGDGRAWVMALVPFLRDGGPRAAAAALGGTALVKTTSTLLAALAATVVGLFLLRSVLPRGASTTVDAGGAARGAPLVSAGMEEAPASATREGEAVTQLPATREPVTGNPRASAREGESLLVHARLVDARGRPFPYAELACVTPRATARANATGAVELDLALDDNSRTLMNDIDVLVFAARAEGYRDSPRVEARPTEGGVLELGELRLYPIGSLGGIVRDDAGTPIADAEVRLVLPGAVDERKTRLFGPAYSLQERRMHADADGRFLFDDVAEGAWCVWAGASDMAWAHTAPLRTERASAAAEIELVLEPLADTNRIEGIVLAAEGGPVARVDVTATPEGASEPASWAVSDADGRFTLAAEAGLAYRVSASQPQPRRRDSRVDVPLVDDRHAPLTVEGVRAGPAELVLVLQPARFVDVLVVERGGEPVVGALVHEQHGDVGTDGFYQGEILGERAGRARVLVPAAPFTLEVRSEDHALATAGPFDPLAPPPAVTIELVPLARVRGVVRAGGAPIGGARVQLMQLPAPGAVDYLYGFPARLDGFDLRGTMTDEKGRYELPIPFAKECALFAEMEGWAAVERSPLRFDPAHDETIDLELTRGGAVAGRVLVPAGESAAGILVRLSRGDMRVHEGVSDAEGRYRIELLTPGPYMVLAERKRAGLSFGSAASMIERVEREHFEFPWALDVRAGETTEHDVDLAAQEVASLAGHLRIDGAAPQAALARLVKPTEPWSVRAFDAEQLALDGNGAFAFEPRRREELVFVLEPGAGALLGTTLLQALAPERGENRIEVELASASLRGRLPAGENGPFALVTEPAPGLFGVTPIPETAGNFALASVPACDAARLVARRAGAQREDPRTWTELARFALPAGGWTELE